MIEIKIPPKIPVGGFIIPILMDEKTDQELDAAGGLFGRYIARLKIIQLLTRQSPQELTNTFVHEVSHAINDIYNADVNDDGIYDLTNGWHQVFEILGIRFVK